MYGAAYHVQLKNNAPHLYVYLEDDSVSIIEMDNISDFKVGDIISGNLDMNGGDWFTNHSQQFEFTGFIQYINEPVDKKAQQFSSILIEYLALLKDR